jgi:glutamate synthase domain-containing protein 2
MSFRSRIVSAGLVGFVALGAVCAMLPGGGYAFAGLAAFGIGLALHDRYQRSSPLLRNFPVVGRLHDLLHFAGTFLGVDPPSAPFRAATAELIRERAEGREVVSSFGARVARGEASIDVLHSMRPAEAARVPECTSLGGADCRLPFTCSYLNISALAFGAISDPALVALSRGAKRGEFYLNTGEAGVPESFFEGGGNLVWQVGTGYFGCRDASGLFDPERFRDQASHPAIRAIEIKLSQGSKPSKGGLLLADKVTRRIADVCQIPMGKDSILPASHSAFDSPLGLLEFVARLRALSGGKPIGFKLCVGQTVDFFAIIKAMLATSIYPDFIAIDGAEGGTGAAPIVFQSSVGRPLAWSLPFVHEALVGAGIRERLRLIASGRIATGADMVWAISMGADLCAAARPFMLAMGCMQALTCSANDCPTGIATQNRRLTRGIVIDVQAERVANFHRKTIDSFRALVAATGCEAPDQLSPSCVSAASLGGERMRLGQLLDGGAPEIYRAAWEAARPDAFVRADGPRRASDGPEARPSAWASAGASASGQRARSPDRASDGPRAVAASK